MTEPEDYWVEATLDGEYVGRCRRFPYLLTSGATEKEALASIEALVRQTERALWMTEHVG